MAKRPSKTADKARKPEKMSGSSLSPQKELAELLKSSFPQVFVEGKIDGDRLKRSLGEELDTNNERYGLSWAGKSECFRHIQETTTATLKPIRSESVDFDKTENIFIEGDNLEVLKILQKTYQNKIKMIYIDPPYNTGNDSFIYPDRFKQEKDDYELRAGIKDAEGLLTKDGFWRKNSKDAGHFHSNWLSMMYPRLFLAKNLLREDGVIFVSIDDNEVHNLRMIMNEIFGEENFVASVVWQHSVQPKGYTGIFSIHHNFLLCFRKNEAFQVGVLERTEEHNKNYANPDNDPKGLWRTGDVRNALYRPNLIFDVKTPSGKTIKSPKNGWRWSKATLQKKIKSGEIIFSKDETRIIRKIYLEDIEGRTPESIWFGKEVGTTRDAVAEIKQLFDGETPFETPKPIGLIKRMAEISCCSDEEDIVLDFFAGSCTTAHAVMSLNSEDGGNRKFICIQLAEPCEEKSEAFKAGFKTIADIGKERIRRAVKKIKKEASGKLNFDGGKLDLGFKVFRLEESNFKQWRENIKEPAEFKRQLWEMVDNVKKGAAGEDMLFEIILKNSRFDLNVKAEKQSFDGVDYYRLAEHKKSDESDFEIVCLAPKITKRLIDKVLKDKPQRFTCLDIAFKNNDQLKTNTALQMESAKVEFKVI